MTIRDYIPADEKLTQVERDYLARGRISRPDSPVVKDYVPDPNEEVKPNPTPEESMLEAREAAAVEAERETERVTAQAERELKSRNVPEALEHMRLLSDWERDIYVQVEKKGRKRAGILQRFELPQEMR